jgi:MFS transporter, PAT family, beta-lactamase induction signal transducer AmpG
MQLSEVADSVEADTTVRDERPWVFGLLISPSAVMANGVIQGGALAYLLSVQGMGSGDQSRIIAMLALPTIWYFLYAPITDFFLRRRTWLLTGGLLSAVLIVLAFHQKSLTTSTALVLMFVSACCCQLVVSSCGGMMGAMKSELNRREAGSMYQAGSMGLGALSALVLVWMSSRVSYGTLGWIAAAMIGLPALFAVLAPQQDVVETGTFSDTMRHIWGECKSTFFRWEAIPYIACMTFPMASGSAVGLLPGVAKQYGVTGDHVALLNGLMGGLLMAAGSAVMALVRSRMRAPVLYMIVALINCATLAVLWLGPLRAATYYAGVVLYLFTVGCCYSMFTAVVLEFLGDSGKSGSGRYSIINSLGNVPVLYMLRVDGWGGDRWGGRGLAGAECVVGAIGATVLLCYLLLKRPARVVAATA